MGDTVLVLERGRIAQSAEPDTLYSRPASPEVARFLNCYNIFPGEVSKATAFVSPCRALSRSVRRAPALRQAGLRHPLRPRRDPPRRVPRPLATKYASKAASSPANIPVRPSIHSSRSTMAVFSKSKLISAMPRRKPTRNVAATASSGSGRTPLSSSDIRAPGAPPHSLPSENEMTMAATGRTPPSDRWKPIPASNLAARCGCWPRRIVDAAVPRRFRS